MSRIRTIKPEFWSDEKMGRLPIECRLLYIGLWNFADDFGVINSNPLFIKSRIFPYDRDIDDEKVSLWLHVLEERERLIPIDYNGNNYYLIRYFSRHQVINRPSASRLLPPEVLSTMLPEGSLTPQGAITENSLLEQGAGNRSKERKMEKGTSAREALKSS